ncbi:Methyltransferase domain-containing protein [Rhizobiales bacterium GAS113]|jgi:hypothetical protein|nr:Methyltransferase domain-containing protein [Rhizobiales bacterium GAS113]SEE79818.1 Methyltransferase domain-containing protein [Rhizobiales bacterium GAS188]
MTNSATHYLLSGFDRIAGWLNPTTAHIMAALADRQRRDGMEGDIAEIGVHHGKSFLALANSIAAGEKLFAIDVFEDQHKNTDKSGSGSRQAFLDNMRIYAPGKVPEIIQESSLDLPAMHWPEQHAGSIRFFSIDGSHTREATLNDLRIAEQTVKAGAIVAVDDVLSSHWLGVISGVFDYLSKGGTLLPFAMVPNKLLLTSGEPSRAKWSEFLRSRYARSMSKSGVKFLDHSIDIIEEDALLMKEQRPDGVSEPGGEIIEDQARQAGIEREALSAQIAALKERCNVLEAENNEWALQRDETLAQLGRWKVFSTSRIYRIMKAYIGIRGSTPPM